MSKADNLVTNYNKKELAEKVLELMEKLEEMKGVEAQAGASLETLQSGSPAIGLHKLEDGTFQLIKIVYDLKQNAAAIIGSETLDKDQQIAGYKLQQYAIEKIFMKARGGKYVD
jgi:hypothetical protein